MKERMIRDSFMKYFIPALAPNEERSLDDERFCAKLRSAEGNARWRFLRVLDHIATELNGVTDEEEKSRVVEQWALRQASDPHPSVFGPSKGSSKIDSLCVYERVLLDLFDKGKADWVKGDSAGWQLCPVEEQ